MVAEVIVTALLPTCGLLPANTTAAAETLSPPTNCEDILDKSVFVIV